jgi:hypothetical protein
MSAVLEEQATSSLRCGRVDLGEQARDLPPDLRIHRQHVDDVGPVVASLVAVTEQIRGDRVAVGLVVDQNAAEGVASRRSSDRSTERRLSTESISSASRLTPDDRAFRAWQAAAAD